MGHPKNFPETPSGDYARATVSNRLERFQKDNKLTRSKRHHCLDQLVGGGCRTLACTKARAPGQDHASIWNREGKPAALVYHPYNSLDSDQLLALTKMCEERGLQFEVSVTSWYFPGRTLMVIVSRRDSRVRS